MIFLKLIMFRLKLFVAHTADGFCSITLNDVDYLEAQNKQVLVCLSNGTTLKIRELFVKCEGVFTPEKGFFKMSPKLYCKPVPHKTVHKNYGHYRHFLCPYFQK